MQVRSPRSTEAYNWCEGQTSQMTSSHHFPRPVLNSNTITVLLLADATGNCVADTTK